MANQAHRENSVLCVDPHGFHRMHYVEWGDPANPRVLFCVHGLTRNARDFDFLAQSLADDYRVVRGLAHLNEPAAATGYILYATDSRPRSASIARDAAQCGQGGARQDAGEHDGQDRRSAASS